MLIPIIGILIIFGFVIYGISQKNQTSTEVVYDYVPTIKIDINSDELTLLLLINEHRKSLGLTELLVDKLACEVAKEPVLKKQQSHYGFSERAKKAQAKHFGEVCAYGYNNAESTFNNYLKSVKHKAVIENPIYSHLGISYIDGYNFVIFTKY